MRKGVSLFIGRIIAAILGLYLAVTFIPQVTFEGKVYTLLLAGGCLGVLNLTLIPLLKLLTTPLRILSLGLLSLIIDMAFIWGITVLFPGFHIPLLIPLLLTTLLVSAFNYLFSL